MKRSVQLITMALVVLSLSACGVSRISLKQDFWNDKTQIIGIAILEYPVAAAHRKGSEGLLDMAINNAVAAEMDEYLKKIDLELFEEVADYFIADLKKEGYQALRIADKINLEKLYEFDTKKKGKYLKVDVGFMREKYGVDKVIFLGVDRYGTLRGYYGFIALGAPEALFQVTGQMVELHSNEIQWLEKMPEKEATVKVIGEWNQPPDYPNLTAAIVAAVEKAKKYLKRIFFKKENI